MFGFVAANMDELTQEEKLRYNSIYCGICRQIREQSSQFARITLRYDMAFLALLLMSLYEPKEQQGSRACKLHPCRPRPWTDNEFIRYGADMNVALAYYKAADDVQDDGALSGSLLKKALQKHLPAIETAYPRQCRAMADCIRELSRLEQENCSNPDLPAGCFGQLLGELLVYREDLWASTLRQMGDALGRYIYLADAAMDYRRDRKKHHYNPFLAMGTGENPALWEQYLVLAMGRCTEHFERLPLVQDKELLNNILYSGVWVTYRNRLRSKQDD